MNRTKIEDAARLLQFEIWYKRKFLFPLGIPPAHLMLDPAVAARVLDLEYEERAFIPSMHASFGGAGMIDRDRGVISISTQFSHQIQRFTGAHEIGHLTLHPNVGAGGRVHRDRPIISTHVAGKPLYEQEADYFAACFLAPARLVIEEFNKRFGPQPLMLDENLAWHLLRDSFADLYAEPRALKFETAIASSRTLDGRHFTSLADHFSVSSGAMAIRLRELDLVRD